MTLSFHITKIILQYHQQNYIPRNYDKVFNLGATCGRAGVVGNNVNLNTINSAEK